MRILNRLVAALGFIGLGAAGASTVATAQTFSEMQREAELACEEALREDTIEALEAYLLKYPFAPTACRALALSALGGFSPDGGGPGTDPATNDGGYGG